MQGVLFITHKTDRFDYLQSIEAALAGGCRQIQLRMKEASPQQVEQTAIAAKHLCDAVGAVLYIDDHVEICARIQAHGVHLGKSDMNPCKAREILGKNVVIGGTANTFEDIVRLHAQGVDYIGLGPFRFTETKKNLSPILGQQGYCNIIADCRTAGIHLPIAAIGGITAGDIPTLIESGVSAVALSSTILAAADPVREMRNIIEIINNHNNG